jgi:hypothetical protein
MNNAAPTSTVLAPDTALAAKASLSKLIEAGRARSAEIIQRVSRDIPQDAIVKGEAMTFGVDDEGELKVALGSGSVPRDVHVHALRQIASKAGVPKDYLDRLRTGDGWQRTLAEEICNTTYGNQGGRYLVRSSEGQVRGFLSDKYRRLDCHQMLEAACATFQELGAIPVGGHASDIKASLRAVIPTVYEPVPGEAMVFGLEWNNTNYGGTAYGMRTFAERLTCLNGMMGENLLREIHLGGRLPDDLELSKKTMELDTLTMVSATRDVILHGLGSKAIQRRIDAVKAAHETDFDGDSFRKAWAKATKDLTNAERTRVKEVYEGPDVVMLPEGQTPWRLSNALSWVANQTEDEDRCVELQRMAGRVVDDVAAAVAA